MRKWAEMEVPVTGALDLGFTFPLGEFASNTPQVSPDEGSEVAWQFLHEERGSIERSPLANEENRLTQSESSSRDTLYSKACSA